MAHEIEAGVVAIVMDPKDHVATALADLAPGQTIRYRLGNSFQELTLIDAIPFGHKAAITAVPAGEVVRKYGDIIGRASQDIQPGQHVHVNNVEGIRGRGDQAHK